MLNETAAAPSARRSRLLRGGLAVLVLAGLFMAASAQRGEPAESAAVMRARLEGYVRLGLSVDHCNFPMSTHEATRLGNAIDATVAALRLPATGYDTIMIEVLRSMEREGWANLCRSNGTWARQYRQQLDAVGR